MPYLFDTLAVMLASARSATGLIQVSGRTMA
jgi:hypothetical protein